MNIADPFGGYFFGKKIFVPRSDKGLSVERKF
jgi:hypothetical protein